MKYLMTCLAVSAVALTVAQQGRIVFKDSRSKPTLQLEGNRGMLEPGVRFELEGNVVMKKLTEGLTLTCATAKGDLKVVDKKSEFDNVRLTGNVVASQVNNNGNSQFNSTSAEVDLEGANRRLKLLGGIRFTQKSTGDSKADFTITGSSASALLKRTGVDPLMSATVSGPVAFDGSELTKTDSGTKLRKMSVRSDTLSFNRVEGGAQVVLTGNIEIKQSTPDEDGPEVSGAQKITLDLNNKNEVTRIRMSAGGGLINTIYKKKGNA